MTMEEGSGAVGASLGPPWGEGPGDRWSAQAPLKWLLRVEGRGKAAPGRGGAELHQPERIRGLAGWGRSQRPNLAVGRTQNGRLSLGSKYHVDANCPVCGWAISSEPQPLLVPLMFLRHLTLNVSQGEPPSSSRVAFISHHPPTSGSAAPVHCPTLIETHSNA